MDHTRMFGSRFIRRCRPSRDFFAITQCNFKAGTVAVTTGRRSLGRPSRAATQQPPRPTVIASGSPDERYAFALRTNPDEGYYSSVWIASSLRSLAMTAAGFIPLSADTSHRTQSLTMRPGASDPLERSRSRIIFERDDRSVPNFVHDLIDHVARDQEPLPGFHELAEPILIVKSRRAAEKTRWRMFSSRVRLMLNRL
jgi:hypothetical protein